MEYSNNKTLVFGASANEERMSHKFTNKLLQKGYKVIPLGAREGMISNLRILTGTPPLEDIHTISLYLNQERQKAMEEYILSLNPQRIIFNPGAENIVFALRAQEHGIEVLNACAMVMLNTDQY